MIALIISFSDAFGIGNDFLYYARCAQDFKYTKISCVCKIFAKPTTFFPSPIVKHDSYVVELKNMLLQKNLKSVNTYFNILPIVWILILPQF